jgi:tripartite-type tricarboxylate transporter receptor subunit TctC
MKTTICRILATGLFLLTVSPFGSAAEVPFYKGKTLTVLINFAVGGPTDIEGRLVARHLAKYIPGQPVIVPNNMAGAGGVTGTNYLGEVAKPDGLTLGYFTSQFFNLLVADPTLRVDLSKLVIIASIEGVAVAYIRKDVPPGIKEPRDIVKAQRFRAGGLTVNSAKDVRFRLQLDLLGVPFQYVTGYNSNSDARLALERNEIQFFTEGTPAYHSVVTPNLVKTNVVLPLYHDELVNAEGEVQPSADAPGILTYAQLYQQVLGKPPSGLLWESLKVVNIGQAMQRIAVLPPGSPPEAVADLKQAFSSMLKDPSFSEEFQKVTKTSPRYTVGPAGDKLVKRITQAPTEVKNTVRQYTEVKK